MGAVFVCVCVCVCVCVRGQGWDSLEYDNSIQFNAPYRSVLTAHLNHLAKVGCSFKNQVFVGSNLVVVTYIFNQILDIYYICIQSNIKYINGTWFDHFGHYYSLPD